MKLKLYFKIQNNLFKNSGNKNLGKPKIPCISIHSPAEDYIEIEDFCKKLKFGIKNINKKYINTPNLSKREFKAILNLRNNKNIVIKSADKGGGTVVLNTLDYENKMLEHLSNNVAYAKIDTNDFDPNAIVKDYLDIICLDHPGKM